MVNFCAVYGCGNRGNRDDKSFYRLPAVITHQGEQTHELTKKRREKWLARINREIKPSNLQHTRVCSDHFISGHPCDVQKADHPDWAPSLKLGHGKISESSSARDGGRYQRRMHRVQKEKHMEAASSLLDLQVPVMSGGDVETAPVAEDESGRSTQTGLLGENIAAMQAEIRHLLTENIELKIQLADDRNKFTVDFFQGNDEKVNIEKIKYYTGLPDYPTLNVLYHYLEPHIPHSSASLLTKFQQMILCFMKLRLNVAHMDLGQRFGVNKTTSSRIFLNMVDVLYIRLKDLIVWPEREELRETMPMSFRTHFGTKVAVILDCFEVFMDTPSNNSAKAWTWSSYKHNNTIKFLIGITPQGSVSYLSKGWGGRTSDKYLTEHCGMLTKLHPGDVVLADRGFDIADSVAMMGATLHIPAFTKGRKQLSAEDVEETRRIANVRIHVERVIGCLRQKYTILQSTLPVDYMASDSGLTTLDKMAIICCALTNLCPSVVPIE